MKPRTQNDNVYKERGKQNKTKNNYKNKKNCC